ncbi:ABC transporter substrate-binding protein SapA [Pragia fontium]|uniref:ABC transporter substrate-binding protein SapA n=1 Tax=Pragia fontium TaxID=82985 RepID=UPI00064A0E12|nr:ABC transporter substrate-binding protein SapA [Pragia fontium]AKJ43823.1 ABC transporter substrate-binding protein [Pragia fontium]
MRGLKIWALICAGLMMPVCAPSAKTQTAPASPVEATPAVPITATPLTNINQSGFVYCVNGVVDSFNPQIANGGVLVDTISAQLYDRLLDVDPYTYRLIPELAERWETLNDGATYRFYLRKDVPFQTTAWFTPTRNMNADDVVFSFSRIFNQEAPYHAVNGGRYPYFDSMQFSDAVKSIRKINDYTVEIQLYKPDASFLWHLATHYAPVLSAEYAQNLTRDGIQENIDRQPVGSGPFLLNEYHPGQFIRLYRNESYWRGAPKMQQVVIDLGAGGTGRLSKLLTGECDVLAYPAASQLSILRDDPRLRISLRSGMNVAYLAFNTSKPPLNDVRVRHAIALAINNPRLMQSIYYGTAETASSILPRTSWAYDNESTITEYDIEKAKQLLQEANVTDLRLHLWVPTASQAYNPSPMKMAELIQADLARINIKVTIVPVEGRFQEMHLSDDEHDLTLTGWATDSNDPDSFFRPLLSCAGIDSQTNYARWCNPEFDRLLTEGVTSQDLAVRIETYQQAQKILAQEIPVLPLASSLRIQAYRYDIKGLVLSPLGNISFADVYREKPESNRK